MGLQVEGVFGDGGLLAKNLPGYEPRRQQVSMAKAVDRVFQARDRIIIEAPTGTGKSVAYLVPAIATSLRLAEEDGDHHPVVVATANIALQEQLVKKDLPFLASILPEKFEYVLFKGSSNYLCLDCLKANATAEYGFDANGVQQSAILDWSQKTTTGDKSELPFEPLYEVWSQFAVTSEDCLGSKCPYRGECFVEKAKSEMARANVIVCNYHLLLANAQLKSDIGKDVVLPPHEFLICDEGHKIAEIARAFFGWTLSEHATNRIIKRLLSVAEDLEKAGAISQGDMRGFVAVGKRAEELTKDVWLKAAKFHSRDKGKDEKGEPKARRIREKGLLGSVEGVVAAFDDMAASFAAMGTKAKDTASNEREDSAAERIKKEADRCREISGQILEVNEMAESEAVYYVDLTTKSKSPRINRRMIDVSHSLWEWVFSEKSVVVTSATLAVDESCEYIREDIGLQVAEEFIVSSPFDYRNQARIVVSEKAPDPKSPEYAEKVCKILEFVIRESQGRALCLFTSYRVMNMARDYLRKAGLPYKILCHGDAPRMQLVAEFKEDISSVLLGTESFWAGVDVPGEACSVVVVDKIPFKSPGDPVWDAMVERAGQNWFWKLAIPAATIQLKQGVGRLIRRKDDKGVVVILDNRMVVKGYGKQMLESLPGMRVSNTLKGTIAKFLGKPVEPNTV